MQDQKAFVLWFTGLSGSGKSTIADRVYNYLREQEYRVEKLDGDIVRDIFPKTGFSKEERNAHVKRIGFLSSILERNGIIVIASFISPYREARRFVRNLCNDFIEVYVSATIEECKKRDVKGLYKKVANGEIKNFTGIDDPYEIPEYPELILPTHLQKEKESFNNVLDYLIKEGKINGPS